jgi:hypothetical protein
MVTHIIKLSGLVSLLVRLLHHNAAPAWFAPGSYLTTTDILLSEALEVVYLVVTVPLKDCD